MEKGKFFVDLTVNFNEIQHRAKLDKNFAFEVKDILHFESVR